MTLSPRANEVPELIRRLGSRRQTTVDAARARLAIQDPRGREPLIAMLLDTDAKMRETAARCLARFPGRQSLAALQRLLASEEKIEVRTAAVEALVEQAASGHEPALGPTLRLLLDAREDARLRQSALALLPALKPAERRGVLKRMRQDPNPELAARAAELSESASDEETDNGLGLRQLLTALAGTE
jgi:HEAT repeat protein